MNAIIQIIRFIWVVASCGGRPTADVFTHHYEISLRWDGNWFYYRVPAEQKADVRGKGSYPLSSMLTRLNYLMEVPSSCGPKGANFVAFIEATSIIGGHNAVEEFLTCGLWPLSEKFGFKVEMKESPLSKVVVPMPQVDTIIGTKESGAEFVACIRNAVNLLVGKYNGAEHNAY
jgi:hypothetical protein